MTDHAVRTLTAAALLAACSTAMAVGQAPAAAADLMELYPGTRVALQDGHVRAIYGMPMTSGRTPEEAADRWWAMHGDAFGADTTQLVEAWITDARQGRFTVFGYQQFIDGVPVEYGQARVLVLNGTDRRPPRVVYAAGRLAARPDGGFPQILVDAETALAIAQASPQGENLPVWSEPELAIWQGDETWEEPVRTWKMVGEVPELDRHVRLTFFVDAATGRVVQVRNEVLHADVTGTIHGMGSPGDLPDIGINPPALLPLPEIRINIVGGTNAFSDREGNFTIPHGGTSNVTVTTNVSSGRWVNVNPQTSAELTLSQTVTPGVPAALVLNTAPSQLTTAQINAFIHTNVVHNFFRDRSGGWGNIDSVISANTAVSGTCNAFYNGVSINFYNAGGGCVNTAYSTVVHHEYGHHIVNRLGLSQGAFGEGFGDTMGVLIMDAPGIGRAWTGNPNTYLRNLETNIMYPCSGESHSCGRVVAGVWRDIRNELGGTYGSDAGLEMARDMAVAWALITMGGQGPNSAHPQTAIEVLTVDDDDGNINNGSPNFEDICAAFGMHNIDCPERELMTFTYPDGLPRLIAPDQPATIRVHVAGVGSVPQPGTGMVFYRSDDGLFFGASMDETAPNEYVATLPALACGEGYEFYFSADTTDGGTQNDPIDAPGRTYATTSGDAGPEIFADDMEDDTGWTVGSPSDTATRGVWNRMNPQLAANGDDVAQPADDHSEPGELCWVTDGVRGLAFGTNDVDGGATTLTTPTIDLSTTGDALIGYWRWYSNHVGPHPNADVFVVEISNDGGATWTNVEAVGPTGPEAAGGWYYNEFAVSRYVTPTASVKLRFIASDNDSDSNVEALIDDFRVDTLLCGDDCTADFDGDGSLTPADFSAFRGAFLAGDTATDFDGDGDLTPADFSAFRTAFLAGCP